ncbi:MAG: cysteine synthase A [Clostridia bacterium]|nr:cysteine synthase A [Clostridia bacterium]
MSKIYKSVDNLIGRTPLMEVCNIEKKYSAEATILAKLEYLNPAGSIKDRAAKQMIDDAENEGLLRAGGTIIEPTSGNTGIGIASISAARGYKAIIIMPDTMSVERINTIKAYGAEVILTPGSLGMAGAVERAEQIKKETPNSIIAGQFVNPSNPKAHILTTGPEIWEDTDGNVDILVAGVGTGGTITGVGEYLKGKNPDVKIVAVEPYKSRLLSGEKAGPHGLQGIGANFIPDVLNTEIYDEIFPVLEEDAYRLARDMGKCEGILVGISSGAALYAAVELAKRPENKGKNIVVILPDTGDRYLSTTLFSE